MTGTSWAIDERPHGARRLPSGVGRSALLALPVGLLLATGFAHRWIADDGFIYLRIVDQLVHGNGPVFNIGERVEAYTSPSWLALLAVADVVLPIRLEWIAVLLGLALSALGVVAAMAGSVRLAARRPEPGRRRALVPVGALVIAAPFAMWVWQTSGLETGLTWAWLGSSTYVLARWADHGRPIGWAPAALLGLGWLVRPELVLFSALFLLTVLAGQWSATAPRSRLGVVGAMVAIPLTYQLFRMGYFGSVVANTAIAKEGTSLRWERGVAYLRDFADPYWLWLPVASVVLGGYVPLARGADRRRLLVLAAFLVGATATTLYFVAIGGDYLHGRLLVPALFALCAPVAAVPLERRFIGMALVVPWALLAVLALRPPQLDSGPFANATTLPRVYGEVTVEDRGWGDGGPRKRWYAGPGLYVESGDFGLAFERASFPPSAATPSSAVVVSAIGIVGYALGPEVHVVDVLGLAHPVGSHFEVPPSAGSRRAGHEKPAPAAWLLAELAAPGTDVDATALGTVSDDVAPPGLEGADLRASVADARLVLECDPVRQLRESATGQLGARRFLRNIVQSPASSLLRIPLDPGAARDALC